MDHGQNLFERMQEASTVDIQQSILYNAYYDYMMEIGETPVSDRRFISG